MHDYDEEVFEISNLTEVFGWENFRLKSVGITVGSSTTHLMFSELIVRRSDSRLSFYKITERKVIYQSPIMLTPYVNGVEVDTKELQEFFEKIYEEAGFTPDDVDTGAIIITGYAARKENSEAILQLFAGWAGKFVCAIAGPNLEAILASHGSGAVSYSRKTGKTVMNVDIGGGTSKISIVKAGTIVDTSSICVGSRIIAMDKNGLVVRIEEAAIIAARELGINLKIGMRLSLDEMKDIVNLLTQSLFELFERKSLLSPLTQQLLETIPIRYSGEVDIIIFSGGVAEYIYDYEESDYGDLGYLLGNKIKQHVMEQNSGFVLEEPAERIRATVMGAAQYSLQVSGNTIFVSSNTILPKINLKVVKVCVEENKRKTEHIKDDISTALNKYDVVSSNTIALAIDLPLESIPNYALLKAISDGIISIWSTTFDNVDDTMVLLFNMDIAKLVGNILVNEIGYSGNIICLDGIEVGELDYVDIGNKIQNSQTVPVVVKNLVFLKHS